MNIKFYSNGIKYRVKASFCDSPTFMFQTSDDRYLEHYWSWEKNGNKTEIWSTEDKIENPLIQEPVWRKLDTVGNDKTIIRDIISALNYNKNNTRIPDHLKEKIEKIIEESRDIWQKNEYEPVPTPIPFPDGHEQTMLFPSTNHAGESGIP